MDYSLLHWQELKTLCKERKLDISLCKGKEAYVKLLKEDDMTLIINPTENDLLSVGIDSEGIRIDKLRADLDSLLVPMRVPRKGLVEKKFGGSVNYSIDRNDNTIHFLGNCLGPICTTLSQPDNVTITLARRYLGTFTYDARLDKFQTGRGMDDDERYAYLEN